MRKLVLILLAAPWAHKPAKQPLAQAERAHERAFCAVAFRTQHRLLRRRTARRTDIARVVVVARHLKLKVFSERLQARASEEPGQIVCRDCVRNKFRLEQVVPTGCAGVLQAFCLCSEQRWTRAGSELE